MKINFYYNDTLCSIINYTIPTAPVTVQNYVSDYMRTAFGKNENPTWDDLEEFLEERCFPRTRHNAKELLRNLDIDYYDPWQIVRKTGGRMAEDHHWLEFLD